MCVCVCVYGGKEKGDRLSGERLVSAVCSAIEYSFFCDGLSLPD